MGMSPHVIGIKLPDEKWRAMQSVWLACERAGVAVPKEVSEFFGHEKPDPMGMHVDLCALGIVTEFQGHSESGYEVKISGLPKDVMVIRFTNAW